MQHLRSWNVLRVQLYFKDAQSEQMTFYWCCEGHNNIIFSIVVKIIEE